MRRKDLIMVMPKKLLLRANWGGRSGSLETEVETVWEFMRRLASHGDFLDAPWVRIGARPRVPLASQEALAADMTRTRTSGDGPFYRFTQAVFEKGKVTAPYASITAALSNTDLGAFISANQVLVALETDTTESDLPAQTTRWLLGLGVKLVQDLVDVWQPDVVSLDSRELTALGDQLCSRGAFPTIGYVSWLSGVVLDPRAVPSAPICQEYEGGTLFGIDPGSADPVGEATELAMRVFSSGMLRPIPKIQGRPDPEPAPPASPAAPAAPLRRGLFGGRR